MGDINVFNTNGTGTGIRIAQVLGITSTAFLCGKTFAQTYTTTPAFLLAPAPILAKQWKKMFDSDKYLAPSIVLLSGGIFGYLASKEPSSSTPRTLYLTSTFLLALTVPYTYFIGEPINQKLETKAAQYRTSTNMDMAEIGVQTEETVHYLVDRKATVNLGRTILTGAASLVGVWGVLER